MSIHNRNQILNQHLTNLKTQLILIDHGLCPDWPRYTHKCRYNSIYLILDGLGKITIDGTDIFPKKNNMVLLPKDSTVSLYSENETCYNKYWCDFLMHFDGVSIFDMTDFPYMIELDDISRAKELLDLLEELHLRNDIASAMRINAALLELVAMFLENDTRGTDHNLKDNPFINDIKRFINEHITEKLSVKILAAEMAFNEKYFFEVFKQNFGTTPMRYIKLARLEKAKNELLHSDDKVSSIITRIGYSSLENLSKDFKAYTGCSPSEFRKKFK